MRLHSLSGRYRRLAGAGASLVVLVSMTALTAPPASAATTIADADDVTSPIDIKQVATASDAVNVGITITAYEGFTSRDGVFTVAFDTDSDGNVDGSVFVEDFDVDGSFTATLNAGPSSVVPVAHEGDTVHGDDTMTIVIPRNLIGGAAVTDVEVLATAASLAKDFAPNTPVLRGAAATRVAGVDRIETAIRSCFAGADTADAVVLVRSDEYADALAGGPLASVNDGCLLLTPSGGLDPRVLAEIDRALPPGGTVYLLGGELALSATVAQAVTSAGYQAVRYAGANRFDTALAVAQQGLSNPSVLFLADGLGFPDALAAGAVASFQGAAVLLTQGSTLPASVSAYLATRQGAAMYPIGGPAAIALPGAPSVTGVDRFDTAAKVASAFFSPPFEVGVASGRSFADALAAGANGLGPVLLTERDSLPAATATYLDSAAASAVTVYGGTAAVSDAVLAQVGTLVGGGGVFLQ